MRYKVSNGFILISPEDKELVDQYHWMLDDYGYAKASVWCKEEKKLKTVRLHKLLIQPEKGLLVDHKDRNPANNQRDNLREVTYQQNWYNSKRADKFFAKGKLKNKALYLEMNS